MIHIQLPNSSRVWLFLASQTLNAEQQEELTWEMNGFIQSWKSHGAELTAGWELIHDTVLLIAVDENSEAPSGCSIDKVFRVLADFGMKNNVDFFNRQLLLMKNGKGNFEIISSSDLKRKITEGELSMGTLVLNTAVSTLEDAKKQLLIPVSESWIGKKILSEK